MAVEGHRYYWNFIYPNGVIAVDKLRAPVGQTTRLEVTAPDYDVIHSWWIPALGGKFDAIPGRINETWFNPERAGIYRGQCAELCGAPARADDGVGRGDAAARSSTAWLAREAWRRRAGRPTLGEETFLGACAKCHGLAGEGGVGPRLAGNQLLADAEAVEQVDPQRAERDAADRQELGRAPDEGARPPI